MKSYMRNMHDEKLTVAGEHEHLGVLIDLDQVTQADLYRLIWNCEQLKTAAFNAMHDLAMK